MMKNSSARAAMRAPLAIILMAVLSLGALAPAAATDTSGEEGTTAESHETEGTSGTSGDPSEPQPESRADGNDGGANGQCPEGPYCSTRDGSASENGKGDGEAKGKPCAGCVGRADNKNPQGQEPNGSDRNAGYECDRNQGVGQGNPAHTGCTEGEEPAAGDDTAEGAEAALGAEESDGEDGEDGQESLVAGTDEDGTTGGDAAGAATAAEVEVLGVEASADGSAPADAAGEAAEADAANASAGILPDTGSPALLGAGLVAGLALLAGGSLVLMRRRT